MSYKAIKDEIDDMGCSCPVNFEDANGDFGIIEHGENDLGKFFKVSIAQGNDWLRIEYHYEDGTSEILYEK